ncbi:rep protein, partial [Escherichia coli]
MLNVTSGSLPLPRRFARYARSSTCGERDHLSHVVGDPVVVLSDEAKKNTEDLEEAKKNSRFTQVSPKGWERVRELLKDSQGI